jgi:hypothetical protein
MPYTHSTALKMDGTVVSWGYNLPTAGSNYVAVAAGAGDYYGVGDWAIYGAPQITEQPMSQTVCSGSLVTLHVGVAAGSSVRSYQWRTNGVDLTDGGNISGATNAILSFASISSGDAGNYTVVLVNEGGTVTSATAVLTVAASCTVPVITWQPQSQLVCTGATATFTVAATGPGPLRYQWRKNGYNLFNGGNISGADSSVLTIKLVSLSDRASYDVVISNPAGSVQSQPAVLRVYQSGDTDGDGLPDSIDADPYNPDTTAPVFVINTPSEGAVF